MEVIPFDQTYTYPVGANAKGFSASDCNNDGFVDIIAAGQQADSVTTLINDENGRFTFGETVEVGSQPSGAVCADFNGDGLVDIAALSRDEGIVSIFYRQESGEFTLAGSRPAGLLPTTLTVGYLNDDSYLDLVAVGSRSNDVTILLGTGTNALPPFLALRVPMDGPHAAAIADFDLDGTPDIAVAGSGDPFVVILFDGAGYAPSAETLPSPFTDTRRPNHSKGIAAGDLNNDGSPDLAVLTDNSSILLYLGDGAGNFTFIDSISGPEGAEAILVEDFDLDGLADLGLLYSSTNSVQILFADGPAVFPELIGAPREQQALNSLGTIDARTVLLDPLDATSTQLQLLALDTGRPAELALVQHENLVNLSIASLLPLADNPLKLRLADLNGDETPDAIVTRKSKRKSFPLDILLGTDTGSFVKPPPNGNAEVCGNGVLEGAELCDDGNLKARDGCSKQCIPELKGPITSVDTAHLDDDNLMDLVVVDKTGQLTILLGDGDTHFREVRPLIRVKRKTPAAVADFTGDGFTDIVVIPKSRRAGALLMLVNDGLGEFVPVAIPASERPRGTLLAGDFDGNGFTDIIAAVRHGWAPFYNDGLGPSRSGGVVASPRKLQAFAAADFDEDGWIDVLATFKPSRRTPAALLYRGRPTGAFAPGTALSVGNSLRNVFVADLDGDLHQDLLSCNPSATPLCAAFYGNGTGDFLLASQSADASIGRDVRAVGAADFDGDGNVDLVGFSRRDNRGRITFRNPNQNLEEHSILIPGNQPAALGIIDLDGNGLPDIVVANEASNDLTIFMSRGQRDYPTPVPLRLPAGGLGAPAIAVGDINADGRPDIAVAQAGSNTTTILLNLGGVLVTTGSLPTGDEPRGIALANLNGDTTLDIVTTNRNGGTFTVLLSQSDGSYTRTDYQSGGQRPAAVAVVDLDDNGFLDILLVNEKIVSNLRTGNVVVFLNDGSATFGAPTSVHVRGRQTPRAICTGDFDADTTLDVAVASLHSNDIMVLHGDGTGGWRSDERTFPIGQQARSLLCFDADQDGRTDIFYSRQNTGNFAAILTGAE